MDASPDAFEERFRTLHIMEPVFQRLVASTPQLQHKESFTSTLLPEGYGDTRKSGLPPHLDASSIAAAYSAPDNMCSSDRLTYVAQHAILAG